MCGITGFWQPAGCNAAHAGATAERMANTIRHRGPDDAGVWVDAEAGIALAHRRLSILDVSPAGHQPMVGRTGRYVLVFNGEIYNHLALREELDRHVPARLAMTESDEKLPSSSRGAERRGDPEVGATSVDCFATLAMTGEGWRGHSDTETLLAGFAAWGIKATIERCIGMFALAVWDRQERVLTLARDRMGEKPLYYGWQGQGENTCFLFGSELKALRAHPAFHAEIDRDALCLFMRHNAIAAPHSIYRGIHKLPPAHLLHVSAAQRESVAEAYWSLTDVAVAGDRTPLEGSAEDVTDQLEALLKSAVGQQMVADVLLGAFLSGGIDSSTIVALMQAQSTRPVKTFSIGFNEAGYNEAVHAKAVAKHLGTEHTELYVTPQQALDVIPKLPALYCEPFSDSSQIPTFLVSQLARQHVTVSLSGDAGDELFGGYTRYQMAAAWWNKLSRMPRPLRMAMAASIRALPPSAWSRLLGPLQPVLPHSLRLSTAGDKLHKGAGVLAANSVDDLYLGLVTHWEPDGLVLGGHEPLTCLRGAPVALPGLDPVQRMMALDAITYLPDDILVKVDRAAMGVSLETRVPFLDHRVVEFAWRIPQSLKLHDGVGKWILRQVLYRHVPRALIERPKMGFGVPIDSWLRGPLRDWAETLLDESRLRQEGYFNPAPIRQKWAEHLSGNRNWQHHLWDVLMFQAWLDVEIR